MLTDYNWKTVYRTGDDNILKDFYLPALSEAKLYDRAVGFFSSELLVSAASGISSLISANGRMRLIIGSPLEADEYEAVKYGKDSAWMIESLHDRLVEMLTNTRQDIFGYRLNLLSWLIACDRLVIKFACRKKGMYHEKIGIITDQYENKLVFQGSANETIHALYPSLNAESLSVYPSWSGAYTDYGKFYEDAFYKLWNDKQKDTRTIELPSESYEKIAELASARMTPELSIEEDLESQALIFSGLHASKDTEPKIPTVINGQSFEIREHQRKALQSWSANSYRGILKLATGSGKTITAIYGAVKMYASWNRLCVIVAVPYIVLAKQWIENLKLFNISTHACFDSKSSWYEKLHTDIQFFKTGHISFLPIVVVNRTLSSAAFRDLVSDIDRDSLLMIGDECHRHGAESVFRHLPDAEYRLGLSATPFQDDEDEIDSPFPQVAKERIVSYYGEIVSTYSLSDAINDDVLVPYKYYIHEVHLSYDEQEEYEELSRKIANLISSGKNGGGKSQERMSLTMLCGQRSRLLGEANEKFIKLLGLIENHGEEDKRHTLFYCPEGFTDDVVDLDRNIDRVSRILGDHGWRSSQFTARESKEERDIILQRFYEGGIDALVSIKVLDEGVDIPACKSAYILASARNPRQYIQRRGRILRKSSGKEFSVIHDFVVLPALGCEEASASKQLIRAELERVNDYLLLATNRTEVNEKLKTIGMLT